jgi:hypothetical protein
LRREVGSKKAAVPHRWRLHNFAFSARARHEHM